MDWYDEGEGPEPWTPEEERDFELRLDAEDELRFAAEAAKTEQRLAAEAEGAGDPGCGAEFIDGSYTYCGCPDCNEREQLDREYAIEAGYAEIESGY